MHNFRKRCLSRMFIVLCSVGLIHSTAAANPNAVHSVKDFGAVGDGVAKDTEAIQSAVDATSNAGGGTVYLPPGVYLSGTIFMKNNVVFHLEAGATLLGSTDLADYPSIMPEFRSYTENYVHQSLLHAENVENITITGRGTIDGQGEEPEFDASSLPHHGYRKRPYIIRFVSCKNITVEKIFLRNSPMWMQLYLACDDVVIHGIRVDSMVNANNDGINIDCCRNVRISDCYIHSGDDAIVLKSTGDRTCENVTVTNCVVSTLCNGIKLGTETVGGFRNISVSNCTVRKPGPEEDWDRERRGLSAIALMIVDGGIMERVSVSNITARGMRSAIFIRLGNRARPVLPEDPKPGIGTIRDIIIDNVLASDMSSTGCHITGLSNHPIQNVSLSDITICTEGGGTLEDAKRDIPELPEKYPEGTMFGQLPSHGFYCRHVEGLRFRNIQLRYEKPDYRPGLVCDNVRNVEIDRYSSAPQSDGSPLMVLTNVRTGMIQRCIAPEETNTFVRIDGDSDRISLIGNDLSQTETPIDRDASVPEEAIFTAANR